MSLSEMNHMTVERFKSDVFPLIECDYLKRLKACKNLYKADKLDDYNTLSDVAIFGEYFEYDYDDKLYDIFEKRFPELMCATVCVELSAMLMCDYGRFNQSPYIRRSKFVMWITPTLLEYLTQAIACGDDIEFWDFWNTPFGHSGNDRDYTPLIFGCRVLMVDPTRGGSISNDNYVIVPPFVKEYSDRGLARPNESTKD